MLSNALAIGEGDTTLSALGDGKGGDGPGGTEHMAQSVEERGRARHCARYQAVVRAVIVSILGAAPTCYDLSLLPASLLTQAF